MFDERNTAATQQQASTLLFVRHGETVWNAQGRWQGWLDSPLSELGIEQAQALAGVLAKRKIDLLYCSDAGRAIQTARILGQPHRLEPIAVEALRERFYGEYEGLNAHEIQQRLPGTRFSPARDTRETWRPPGGETMAEVRERVRLFLQELLGRHSGKTILFATHSGVVRAADSICTGQSFDQIWHRVPSNCCLYVVRALAGGAMEVVQDYCHDPKGLSATAAQ